MSDPLYRMELLRLAADATGAGRLPHPHATGVAFNPSCGDRVTVDLSFEEGRIVALAHETKACVLAQASASVLGTAVKGARRADVERLREELLSMLKEQTGPPAPPYGAYCAFEGAAEHPSRHRCVLLPIEAVLAAMRSSDIQYGEPVGRQGQ
jgi:nitrogen fixation protein NifU and related proteins